jgi:hypothetical protein
MDQWQRKYMRRSILLPALLLVAGGCSSGSGAPGKLPDGASGGMYSTGEPQAIAACIASAVNNGTRPIGDRLVIDSVRHPGTSYSVGPNGEGVYTTQIAVMGSSGDTDEAKRVGLCASAGITAD